ncbi:MAG: pyridoxal kinase [Rhodospirillaceae bacterium]|jgi:pyridoxine kinase|nr:pyridoxal kinase [Rhodospirillaceae bacterium]MBT4489139.1 pyridoxal kinase [Rhodospirillaceae bacterium]MBT5192326.1 pyridoxal kinase [Rhodospirillaceae bacterium]MBT5894769.1 pyridoxal kinase [Rhodospirillaceae bacterium]MBT7757556.1 pyridoxal kinase [Rhodospirillaceae bacterium]
MANIFSLTSHVVYGHVGGQAAVPAFQAMGHEVWHLPTVLFSNHPGHGGFGGGPVPLEQQNHLLDGLVQCGFLDECGAVHTGYLGHVGSVEVALRAIAAVEGPVLCDPVLGDDGELYVEADLARAVRDRLLPKADLVTPNRFELGWLANREISNFDDAVHNAHILRQQGVDKVVCTSAAQKDGWLHNLAVDESGVYQVRVPLVAGDAPDAVPKGTGDAFAAILLGHFLNHGDIAAALAWASAALHGLIKVSMATGSDELALVEGRDQITAPDQMFEVERLS